MSVRPHAPLLCLALAVLGAAGVALWRGARLESLDEAAVLLLALALWFAARRAGVSGALGLSLGVIVGEWLRPWSAAHVPALPGLEGASAAMLLLVLAWMLGRAGPVDPLAGRPLPQRDDTIRMEPAHEAAASPPLEVSTPRPPDPPDPPAAPAADADLVGQVVHELRTPLNAMTGWLHVLDAGAAFDEATLAKARVGLRRAVIQQRDLIDAVDELSRAGSGDLQLARSPVDLRAVLGQSVEPALSLLGDGRTPSLSRPAAGVPIWVEADADRLGRLLVDVLVVVARLCPPGATLRLDAGETAGEPGSAWVDWTVAQDAPDPDGGFGAVLRERVEGHAKDGRPRPPLLAIRRARAIAGLHGGALVRVEDESSIGLRLTLPLGAQRPASVREAPAGAREASLAGLRLLVVDDQEEMRDMLVTLLGQQGARVSQAEGAQDALSLIDAAGDDRFDLAVLDVAMPGEDGLSLVRRIRAAEGRDGRAPMGAIALTAHAGAALEREALASGFDAFLPKPLDPTRLVTAIRTIRPAA